jgi:hypothetical protein
MLKNPRQLSRQYKPFNLCYYNKMGVTVDRDIVLKEYGTTLKATWASTAMNTPTVHKRQVGTVTATLDNPEPENLGEPIYVYKVSCVFEYWTDEQARKDGKKSIGSFKTAIDYDTMPDTGIYELLYENFKKVHGYSDPDAPVDPTNTA